MPIGDAGEARLLPRPADVVGDLLSQWLDLLFERRERGQVALAFERQGGEDVGVGRMRKRMLSRRDRFDLCEQREFRIEAGAVVSQHAF